MGVMLMWDKYSNKNGVLFHQNLQAVPNYFNIDNPKHPTHPKTSGMFTTWTINSKPARTFQNHRWVTTFDNQAKTKQTLVNCMSLVAKIMKKRKGHWRLFSFTCTVSVNSHSTIKISKCCLLERHYRFCFLYWVLVT